MKDSPRGVVLEREMRSFGRDIPPVAAAEMMAAMRNVVAQRYPGQVDVVQALALFTVLSANMLADFLVELEKASPITAPAEDGRVVAVENVFHDVLRQAIVNRVLHKLREPLAGGA